MLNYSDKSRVASYRRPAATNKPLQEALAKRDRYLELHPHLRAYQAEIDKVLDKSGNVHGRLAVLETMIQGKLLDMQQELQKLTGKLH